MTDAFWSKPLTLLFRNARHQIILYLQSELRRTNWTHIEKIAPCEEMRISNRMLLTKGILNLVIGVVYVLPIPISFDYQQSLPEVTK